MDDAQPPAPQSLSSVLRQGFPALLALVVVPAALYVMTRPGGQELASDPADDGKALMIALAVGALCFGVMIGVTPRSVKTVLAAIAWPFVFMLIVFPVSMVALERLHESADFSNAPIERHEGYLTVESASIHRSKGGLSYTVWLAAPVLLTVDPGDYRAAFGDAERVRPEGYCVHVMIETAGKAGRILADPGETLPAGTLVRCPGRS